MRMTKAEFSRVSDSEWDGIAYESYLRWMEASESAIGRNGGDGE